jgi:hypothetical protein
MSSLAVRPRTGQFLNASNRLGLDYRAEAATFPRLGFEIIDVHSHINGPKAALVMRDAMDLYGIGSIVSMTHLEQVPAMREIFGDRIRFIAIPDWASKDREHANGPGFLERIERYHALGARIVKFWQAPRLIDLAGLDGDPRRFALDSPTRVRAMELADSLDMIFMAHIADPDTWFRTKYADGARYGTKRSHYEPLEALLERFRHRKWMVAHMGGWPEDLDFLSGLLDRHPNLVLDTSATKWVVREVSRHSPADVRAFFVRHRGRLLFGSDIVTADEHFAAGEGKTEMQAKADSAETAFDLYASRYWALRMLWEGDGEMESPISDPDLAMVEPSRYGPNDAPALRGMALPPDILRTFYRDAALTALAPAFAAR